jgi:hypothetical protein
MASAKNGQYVENEENEKEEKLEKRLKNQHEYLIRLEKAVIQYINNDSPKHYIRRAVWLFARYIAFRLNENYKRDYKDYLPYAEKFALNYNDDEAFNKLLDYFDNFDTHQKGRVYFVRIKTQTVEIGPVEQKLNESRINEYMRFALKYIEENKTVSFTQLKHYLISNKMFIEENVLIQELKKLENNLIRIQYDIEENNPNLIEWEA